MLGTFAVVQGACQTWVVALTDPYLPITPPFQLHFLQLARLPTQQYRQMM